METLLAAITILQRAGGKRLLLRLFSRLVVLLGLVITTAVMAVAMCIGGLINGYSALLNSGMPAPAALSIIGASALFIIVMLITMIVWQLRRIYRLPQQSPLIDILDAFTAGLMAEQEKSR